MTPADIAMELACMEERCSELNDAVTAQPGHSVYRVRITERFDRMRDAIHRTWLGVTIEFDLPHGDAADEEKTE